MMSAMTVPAKSPDSAADAEEIRAFLAGDETAFERLVDRHQRAVLHLCQRLLGQEESKDLFQEVFLQAYRSLPQLRAAGAFRNWLFRIAVRRARRRIAARRPPLAVENAVVFAAPRANDPLELDEDVERLRGALALLPERQREVVVLRHYHELGFPAIAEILGSPVTTVKSRMARGLTLLRARLATLET